LGKKLVFRLKWEGGGGEYRNKRLNAFEFAFLARREEVKLVNTHTLRLKKGYEAVRTEAGEFLFYNLNTPEAGIRIPNNFEQLYRAWLYAEPLRTTRQVRALISLGLPNAVSDYS